MLPFTPIIKWIAISEAFKWGGGEYRELQEELEELGMGEYDQRKGPTYFHLQE